VPCRISQGRRLSSATKTQRRPIIRSITHAPDHTVARLRLLHGSSRCRRSRHRILSNPNDFHFFSRASRPSPTQVRKPSRTPRQLHSASFVVTELPILQIGARGCSGDRLLNRKGCKGRGRGHPHKEPLPGRRCRNGMGQHLPPPAPTLMSARPAWKHGTVRGRHVRRESLAFAG